MHLPSLSKISPVVFLSTKVYQNYINEIPIRYFYYLGIYCIMTTVQGTLNHKTKGADEYGSYSVFR